MALGFAASMAVHPPLAQWLSDQVGWREAWLWLGVLTWMLLIPPILLLIQNMPEDLGLQPDGRGRRGPGLEAAAPQGAEVGLTVKQALRTPAFWITALSLATLSMLVTALFFHQVSIFTHQGVDAYVAARVFSVSAITMVVAMPMIGRLLDRFPTKPIFACAMLTQSAALIAIVFVDDLTSAVLYAVVFGLNNAAVQTYYTYVWPRFFGRRHLGSIQGTAQTIGIVGALGRTAAVRRGVRPVRQLHGRAPGLRPAAGAVRDRDPPHAAAAPGQSRRRRATGPGPLSAARRAARGAAAELSFELTKVCVTGAGLDRAHGRRSVVRRAVRPVRSRRMPCCQDHVRAHAQEGRNDADRSRHLCAQRRRRRARDRRPSANCWAARGWRVTLITFEPAGTTPYYAVDPRVALRQLGIASVGSPLWRAIRQNLRRIRALRQALRAADAGPGDRRFWPRSTCSPCSRAAAWASRSWCPNATTRSGSAFAASGAGCASVCTARRTAW